MVALRLELHTIPGPPFECDDQTHTVQKWFSTFGENYLGRLLSCQANVTFSSDNLSHREQTEPMPMQCSYL